MEPGGFTGKCVRASKFCMGNTLCKKGLRNTVQMGLKIDEMYHKMETPNKVKIAISGCPNSCAEPAVRDIGLIGAGRGWNMLVGGTCGIRPRIGKELAKNLSDEEVIQIIGKILEYYKEKGIPKRMGSFIEEIGFDKFSKDILR
jgi:NAD(P)H-nitrite reductase large subunit